MPAISEHGLAGSIAQEPRNGGLAERIIAVLIMVNHAGTLYQKNIGPNTDELAKRITAFDPDKSWEKVSVESPVQ